MIRVLKAGFVVLVVWGAFSGAAQADGAALKQAANAPAPQRGAESSVFALFDRGVMSMVAANSCKSADKASLQSFAEDFAQVADLVQSELQGMNPGQRRDDLEMVIGFRVAQLELRAEDAIKRDGCNARYVKSMRQLFNVKAQLAMVQLEDHTVSH